LLARLAHHDIQSNRTGTSREVDLAAELEAKLLVVGNIDYGAGFEIRRNALKIRLFLLAKAS
jgi:hypothetical protein